MKKMFIIIAASLLWLAITPVNAEVIKLTIGSQAANKQQIDRPENGIAKARVKARFGEPLNTTGPVGEPPISSWEYPDYMVFFEYDTVLHTVLKHVPVAQADPE